MQELEQKIFKFIKDRNWHKPMPADLAKSILIEGAELLEHFQWGNPTVLELRKDKKKIEEIKEEIADVLIYTINLSMLLGLDTSGVVEEKLKKQEKKYPSNIFNKNSSKKGTQEKYFEIKKKYRSNKRK